VVMFLTTTDNLTLPYLVWSIMSGDPGMAASLSLLSIALMLPFVWSIFC